jgi:hypothetical protein
MRTIAASLFVTALIALIGCSAGGGGDESACTPGDSKACTCNDGASGAQVCKSDGAGFESCDCSGSTQDVIGGDADANDAIAGDTKAETTPSDAEDPGDTQPEVPVDNVKPTVSITAPLDGEAVDGQVSVEVAATDDRGVAQVELAVNGALAKTLTSAPWIWTWDVSGLQGGPYTLRATAFDEAGNEAFDEVTVQVVGACGADGDCPPSSVSFITPVDGAEVCGVVTLEAAATDDQGVVKVVFSVDGVSFGVAESAPFQRDWDTSGVSSGVHVLRAEAFDATNQSAFAEVSVTVNNGGGGCDNDPNVKLVSPEVVEGDDAAYVTGVVEVKADASDDVGVTKVQFFVDNGLLFEDNSIPYKFGWDTGEFDEGVHTLKAIARDTSEQTATVQIQVTVDRTPPELEVGAPEDGAFYGDTLPLGASATDNFGVDRVVFALACAVESQELTLSEAPFETVLDTSAWASGDCIVTATVSDKAGLSAQDERSFSLDRPPLVAFVSPSAGQELNGPLTMQVDASDDLSQPDVTLAVDGAWAGTFSSDGSFNWTPPFVYGEHVLTATAQDGHGQESEASVTVLVDWPFVVEPQVCAPDCADLESLQELSGVVPFQVNAEDDAGAVASVDLFVDGAFAVQASESPFDLDWDSRVVGDGEHVLRFVATGITGATGDASVTMVVNNCDLDHDGYLAIGGDCEGSDCDDADATINPNAIDTLGDGIDQNCDAVDGVDSDGDGYLSEESGGFDCDDGDVLIHPCVDDLGGDGEDTNCDGEDILSCDDCDACTTDAAAGNACEHTPYIDGQACDDGDACTTGDVCTVGDCAGPGSLSCDDGDLCTLDGCEPVMGCVHEVDPASEGVSCSGGVCHEGFCCAPDCSGQECGDDGCGGSCGDCGLGESCDQGQCFLFIWKTIPAGTFKMGCSPGDSDCSSYEKPAFNVTVSSFEILETEVTEGQYFEIMGTNPSDNYNGIGGDDAPVEHVTWYEADEFCETIDAHLCWGVEWEYAARGGTTTKYYCGDSSMCLDGIAWYYDNSDDGPGRHKHDVKGRTPNAYGLYDMLGNIWEWTADWHPIAETKRVVRGGDFVSHANDLRVSRRNAYVPSYRYATIGFRCCRSLESISDIQALVN